MQPEHTAAQYDAIAATWSQRTFPSRYGLAQLQRAMGLVQGADRAALDVGCGGGRLAVHLLQAGFQVTALDASAAMVAITRQNAPAAQAVCAEITTWTTPERFDLVVAWDSTFHLPRPDQVPVLRKLCGLLRPQGVLLFTALGADLERTVDRDGQRFHYASVDTHTLLQTLAAEHCDTVLVDHDQYPEHHVALIAVRRKA